MVNTESLSNSSPSPGGGEVEVEVEVEACAAPHPEANRRTISNNVLFEAGVIRCGRTLLSAAFKKVMPPCDFWVSGKNSAPAILSVVDLKNTN